MVDKKKEVSPILNLITYNNPVEKFPVESKGESMFCGDGFLLPGHSRDLVTMRGVFAPGAKFHLYDKSLNHRGTYDVDIGEYDGTIELEFAEGEDFSKFVSPLYTLDGLYERCYNPLMDGGKLEFLENFLGKEDKSGDTPKETLAKSSYTRRRLLENHYKNNIEFYARHPKPNNYKDDKSFGFKEALEVLLR